MFEDSKVLSILVEVLIGLNENGGIEIIEN